MKNGIRRVFVEKREGFQVEAAHLLKELKDSLGISGLKEVRIVNRYDLSPGDLPEMDVIKNTVLSEPNADRIWEGTLDAGVDETPIPMEYLPGQYDQRADWASQGIRIVTHGKEVAVRTARIVLLKGALSEQDVDGVKKYLINPVDSREADLELPVSLDLVAEEPADVAVILGLTQWSEDQLDDYRKDMGFAMSREDLAFVQAYFKDTERRDPTLTELKVIDTYWSDHCRHTTFLTEITRVDFVEGFYREAIQKAYEEYLDVKKILYPGKDRPTSLMDLATMNAKWEKRQGRLEDLDESEEINACSIRVDVDVDGKKEPWLLMFKNETHNHPTEIEPYGGAATCLGGAIRDPLSGRSYVYQAMRVTGAADPRTPLKDTLPGKLPQRKICREAAKGFSAYGNQIGLATGQVTEIYDPGYLAKRMEIGAVVGAAPEKNVVRERPQPGDVILLIGGRTGRDGCGGATGSSKIHTMESILESGAEVQKGNPPEERKLQRLFRHPRVASMIKRCNDFGAGGVSVAIGELAESLDIDLDAVPKKYEGLDGTELAISESQERMAVVVAPQDVEEFYRWTDRENIEATTVAKVTDSGRLVMHWRKAPILNISRAFLDTNGVKQQAQVRIEAPEETPDFLKDDEKSFEATLKERLKDLNGCSQQGLGEMFDSTIGAATVLMPYGGTYRCTPPEGMAAKFPLLEGETTTCSMMAYGYQPEIAKWSPFHGGVYAIVESVSKIVAMGGEAAKIRLSLQEYFERLGNQPDKWGKPFAALLGAFHAQKQLGLGAIGGKDSMSGSFEDLHVPPTLVSFAVTTNQVQHVLSPEWKKPGSLVVFLPLSCNSDRLPEFSVLSKVYQTVRQLVESQQILSAKSVGMKGLAHALALMSFGNRIGVQLEESLTQEDLFGFQLGGLVLELHPDFEISAFEPLRSLNGMKVGRTLPEFFLIHKESTLSGEELFKIWKEPLSEVYPESGGPSHEEPETWWTKGTRTAPSVQHAKPKVFIPVFPGTNCEFDTIRAFKKAGAEVEAMVFRNQTPKQADESMEQMAQAIGRSQILMFPGGFSAGDEPEGSAKFIAAVFRNNQLKDRVAALLDRQDGLILGICNGFQALIKLGLLPYGTIRDLKPQDPTLTFNEIGRHISAMTQTRITSNLSPWLSKVSVGDVFSTPISHGEGRFAATDETMESLVKQGQIAIRYFETNPNGSRGSVEAISSPDGRILGKMGHSERIGFGLYRNIPGQFDQKLFEAGVDYFR